MEFTTFTPLWLLLLVLPAAWIVWRKSLVDRRPALKWAAHGLRLLALLLLVLALCRPYALSGREDLHVVVLVDVSESVDPESIRQAADEVEVIADGLKSDDKLSILRFGSKLLRTSREELETLADEVDAGTADAAARNASRLRSAILGSRLSFAGGLTRRLVVYSDGIATDGGLDEALKILEAEGVEVRFRKMEGLQRPEAALVGLEPLASIAYRGEIVRMRLKMRANRTMTAKARILHRGVAVAETPVSLEAGKESIAVLDVEMTTPGESRWEAELIPEDDWFPVNNRVAATVTVKGEPRLLVLHRNEKEMRPFVRAMKKQGLEFETRGEQGMPETLAELLEFDGLVFADVAATSLNMRQMEMVRSYVSDFGGGVAMLGSENSFGLGGYYRTPIEETLPLTSRYEKEKQKPSLAMVLVIDKSGSMSGAPIELARASAKAAAELLSAQDQIAVVGFDEQTQVVLDMTSAADRGTVINSIETLEASGGTDAYPGMVKGRELLQNSVAKVKHMIVLSDGQTPDNDFPGLVRDMRAQGMTVSSVALGSGAAKDLMQVIAQEGGGRYYETDDPANMPQIFTKETMQASRSAIKEDLYSSVVNGDHPVLSGYEEAELPFVLGYVMSKPKPTANLLLVAETGDPLLAIGRYGLGTGLAFTSDLTEKWGGEWLGWGRGPAFWAQVFRGIVRKEQSAGLSATPTLDGENWMIGISRRDESDRPVDRVNWEVRAKDENGKDVAVKVRQTGVGRYLAKADLRSRERVTLSLRDLDHGLMKTLGWERDYPAEYRLDGQVRPELRALAGFDPSQPRDGLVEAKVYRDVSHWFVLAAFALLITGVALRRV
ncbi:VWA domain-containing protein [Haloferula chungangensis]|uniref:VWA domain-containing protein n=1 Tax=Haloferula chungangensis TaxID=1048331 RepID=A0ABW2L473_9BACT